MIGFHFFGGIPRKAGAPSIGDPVMGPVQGIQPGQQKPKLGLGEVVVDPFHEKRKNQLNPHIAARPTEAKKAFQDGKINVRWVAPLLDGSGYAEAGRNYVAALSTAGVNVMAHSVSFENSRSDYGRAGKLSEAAIANKINYAINVVFLTPDHFPIYREMGAYNIGLFDWETDFLPPQWVTTCNEMDEIWVPCQWTADVAKKSKVTRPIHVFGHCASPDDYTDGPTLSFQEVDPSWYKFYSIFQWTERKNPRGLLQSYLKAFTDKDPVILILKTYRANYSESEQAAIVSEIEKIKGEVGGAHQPRVMALLGMMTKEEMQALHRTGDCFALIHRSEGWGLPHFEACMMGKPVITTNYSANLELPSRTPATWSTVAGRL
jgi:glycosyltransferase involved in cell wall biosynthesis